MNKNRKLTFIEMFVGAGGSHLGFRKTCKFKTILVSDINEDMCKTFKFNNPEVEHVICEDIHNLRGRDILKKTKLKPKELDVIFGGIVCKGFSLAGVRSSTDPRNDLYKNYISLVEELQPKVAVIENVPGMKSMMVSNGTELTLDKKEEINKAWGKLKNLNGIKSAIRKGLSTKEQKKEADKIEKNKNYYRKLIKEGSMSVVDDIKRRYELAGYNTLEPRILRADDYGSATSRRRLIIIAIRKDFDHNKFEWPKKTNKKKTVGAILAKINYNKKDPDNIPMNHSDKSVRRFSYIPEGENIVSVMNKLPEELKISSFYSRGCTMRLAANKPAPTLVPGHSNFPVHPKENRSITVREAAQIMGFPKNYKFFGSHSKRCEQVGQAVAVEMAKAIGDSISKFLTS